jgi:hypothetical protein
MTDVSRRTLGRREAAQLSAGTRGARRTRVGLTASRRKALGVLMHGRRHDREVTDSNMTTPPERWESMPLMIHHQASAWLVEQLYASAEWWGGRNHVTLTATGVHLAEQEGL